MTFKKPRGTLDYYPEEKAVFNRMAEAFRQTALRYGYKEVEAPAFETMELLNAKQGEEIKDQIFTLEKRGDEALGLRFELTTSFARMFVEKQKELPKPVKWFGISRMWRYERPQAGRLREFYQFSVECFGADNDEADAEIVSMAIDALCALGLTKNDFTVRINNKKLLKGLLIDLGIKDIDSIMRVIDKSSKITEKEFGEELEKAGLDKKKSEAVGKLVKTKIKDLKNLNDEAEFGLSRVKNILELIEDKKEFVEVDLSIARGLAYYTGTVFEIFDKKGKYRALAGGGRYDNLVEQFQGEICSATGFAIGFATLGMLLKDRKLIQESPESVDYYVAPVNESVRKEAFAIASKLRAKSSVEIDLLGRNLRKQLDYANTINARKVIIVGEKDLANKEVTARDMKSGKEEKVKISKL